MESHRNLCIQDRFHNLQNPPPKPFERSRIVAMDLMIASPLILFPDFENIPDMAQPDGILI